MRWLRGTPPPRPCIDRSVSVPSRSAAPSSPATRPFPWIGLLTLAGAIFVSVTTEFLPTGLLPDMAHDLRVDVSTTGLLVTVFAGAVVGGTTPLAALTRRQPRKRLVVAVLLAIAVAAVGAALAPTYPVLVAARVIGGLAHGLFWAVVATYGAHLVPRERLGLAIAITSAGGSAAFVLGVPVGTALGHALGWRPAFGILGVVAAALALVVVAFLPPVEHGVPLATGELPLPLRRDPTVNRVVLLCVVIVLAITGQYTFYTYMAPWFLDVAHLAASAVPGLLFLYGAGGAVGLVLAGIAADRFPKRGFVGALLVSMAAVVVLAVGAGSVPVVLAAFLLWGVAFGAVPPLVQTRMMRTASRRVRDLAGALQTTAFNVGIGGGALFGALLLTGPGMGTLPLAAVVLVAAGLVLGLLPELLRRPALRPLTAD
jgi:predicted MFS family arabinose efflux permease